MNATRGRPIACLLALALAAGGAAGCTTTSTKRLTYHFKDPVPLDDPAFRRSLDGFGNAMLPGNRALLLQNGDEIFSAMVQAIAAARRTVNLESYIFSNDAAGSLVTDALVAAARRGVEVRVLIDGLAGHPGPLGDRMTASGVNFRIYHPIRPWNILRLGQRTHRKILVVDGAVCFTGGVGIEQRWLGNARNPKEWRDTQIEVTGPAASQMQAIFSEDWTYTTGEILAGDKFYPAHAPGGDVEAQAIKVARGDSSSLAKMLYYVAIQSATKSIHIQNAYFLPDAQMRTALLAAVHRGVDVRIMIPGKEIDVPLVRMASRACHGELLQGGVHIYEYLGTMMHSKNAVFDHLFTIVGSINLDARSMEKNAEDSIATYDANLAAKAEAMFTQDLTHCREITYARWRHRGLRPRIAELLSNFFTPLY